MKLSNLRIEKNNSHCRLVADVDSKYYEYTELFFEVPNEYGNWLSYDVYDAFVIALIYPCMKHQDDIDIDGALSPRFYRNLTNYAMRCISWFSHELHMIKIVAKELKIPDKRFHNVGTGFSGGVDSFQCIYDRFEKENDPKYRVNALLCFNAGSHGDYDDERTLDRFKDRYNYLKKFPDEIGLPYIPINTNVHAFMDEGHVQSGVTRHISCALALQAAIDKYYYASSLSYYEEKYWAKKAFEFSLAEFCDTQLLPWISTEAIDLISEGGQYLRTGKTERIANYIYAQKYLNVCVNPHQGSAENCSCCDKCKRTLLALDSLGVLDKYKSVFDIQKWNSIKQDYIYELRLQYGIEPFATDNLNFYKDHGGTIPSLEDAQKYFKKKNKRSFIKRAIKKIIRIFHH